MTGNKKFILLLGLMTLTSALTLPVNPWPLDGWFHSQERLFGTFPGADNYTPIAAPAVFYKINHLFASALQLGLTGEFYLASLAQNGLLLLSACLIFFSCQTLGMRWTARFAAIAFLIFVLSTAAPQAMWSDSVVISLFSAILFTTLKIYCGGVSRPVEFGMATIASGLIVGVLVVTRAIPILLMPALSLLFYYSHLSRRRFAGYVLGVTLIPAIVIFGALTSNYARFGRFELTNSSGRHLWESVKGMSDAALAASPKYLSLRQLNPELQGKGWWQIQFPSGAGGEFYGDNLLREVAKDVIRNRPLSYFALGAKKFATTVGRSPDRIGYYSLPDWYRRSPQNADWAGDPLHADGFLPSIVASGIKLPKGLGSIAYSAQAHVFELTERLYPFAIFLVLTTYCIGFLIARRSRYTGVLHVLFGIPIVAVASFGIVGGVSWAALVGSCLVALTAQATLIQKYSKTDAGQSALLVETDGIFYSFLVFMFFGSLWLGWQFESGSTRHALSYSPFLAIMVGMALTFWMDKLGGRNYFMKIARSLAAKKADQIALNS
jgi:hypothetical protein